MIKRKLDRYVQVLNNIDDDQDKFLWIMDFGKNSRPMEDSLKTRGFEVPGCQSQTWLVPHFVEDKIYFTTSNPDNGRGIRKNLPSSKTMGVMLIIIVFVAGGLLLFVSLLT